MDVLELLARSVLFVLVVIALWLGIRLIKWVFRLISNPRELARKAGSVTASATKVAGSVKDSFVDGYKERR